MFGDRKYGSPQNAITVWKDHMVSQGFGFGSVGSPPRRETWPDTECAVLRQGLSRTLEWTDGNQYSIGQGKILATPFQIANLGATIANRGYFITPHIVKEIEDNQLDSIYRTPRYLQLIDRGIMKWW